MERSEVVREVLDEVIVPKKFEVLWFSEEIDPLSYSRLGEFLKYRSSGLYLHWLVFLRDGRYYHEGGIGKTSWPGYRMDLL